MPVWFFPALIGLFATVSIVSGIWLFLKLPAIARLFRGTADIVGDKSKRTTSPGALWFAIILFMGGWIACVLIYAFAIAAEPEQIAANKLRNNTNLATHTFSASS